MVKLIGALSHLKKTQALVAGDFFLDSYAIGKANRLSPEAPVIVVQAQEEMELPGGAGNVVNNLLALQAQVYAMGRIGDDSTGKKLTQILQQEGCSTDALLTEANYPTGLKRRIVASNQQIVRIDYEKTVPLSSEIEDLCFNKISPHLEKIEIIAVSDYGKGFVTPLLFKKLQKLASERAIPLIVDPKGSDFSKYRKCTLLKPNQMEAYQAAHLPITASLEEVAERLFEQVQMESLLITRSEEGMTLFLSDLSRHDFPSRLREVRDVTGAGDTVLSMLICALGSRLPLIDAVLLANIAGGLSVEKFGCAKIHFHELFEALPCYHIQNKIVDSHHLFALKNALKGHPVELLEIKNAEGLMAESFQAIRQAASKNKKLLLHIREEDPNPSFLEMLASLQEVSFILCSTESVDGLLD